MSQWREDGELGALLRELAAPDVYVDFTVGDESVYLYVKTYAPERVQTFEAPTLREAVEAAVKWRRG